MTKGGQKEEEGEGAEKEKGVSGGAKTWEREEGSGRRVKKKEKEKKQETNGRKRGKKIEQKGGRRIKRGGGSFFFGGERKKNPWPCPPAAFECHMHPPLPKNAGLGVLHLIHL